jgi:hypothetical protein
MARVWIDAEDEQRIERILARSESMFRMKPSVAIILRCALRLLDEKVEQCV